MSGPIDDIVQVVGIGADGWEGVSRASRTIVGAAQVLLGGPRQLALVPDIPGQERVLWPSPLKPALPGLFASLAGRSVTVLASGDPLVSGIGSTLIDLLGPDRIRIVPAVSSVALAAAAMNWAAESFDVLTVVGRDPASVLRAVSPGRRLIVLSSNGSTPVRIAELLAGAGYGPSMLTVLSDLGSSTQSRLDAAAESFPGSDVPALNVVAVRCVAAAGTIPLPTVGGLPDDAFEHDGQLTKRDARASAIARLVPLAGQLLWDVGAGAGSVAIEWLRADPRCRAIAVEREPARVERIQHNASRLGVPALDVVTGTAPAALADLETPDAIFVGGGATVDGLLDTCWMALGVGGRLVVHGVTVETESILVSWHRRWGGELVRLLVERVEPIGSFRGWTPARAIVQWSITKPPDEPPLSESGSGVDS